MPATKSADYKAIAKRLQALPNVGPAVAQDLIRIGITEERQLVGQDPDKLYAKLNRVTGMTHDICMLDTFAALVHNATTGEALPWWEFSRRRKSGPRV